ncbi:MAG: Hpt domain-containing protein, partial [Streptosporangiaceae bacterium]
MSGPDDEIEVLFRDEAKDRIDRIDAGLLAVEAGAAGAAVVDELFREAHTIKGAAGLLGLTDASALAHAMEDVLAAVRASGEFPPRLADLLMRASRLLRGLATRSGQPDAALLGELAAAAAAARGARRP